MRQQFLAASFTLLSAATTWGQECNSIEGSADRLICYDAKFPRTVTTPDAIPPPVAPAVIPTFDPPPVETGTKLPAFMKNFKLANEATPSGSLRSDPASFSYAKLNGEEFSTVQAALIWAPSDSWFPAGSYLADYGWGPIASFSMNRNSLSTKRADVRQGAFGFYGTLFRIHGTKEPGTLIAPIALGVVTKFEAAYRRNKVDDTESVIYTMDNWFVSRSMYDGIPYSSRLAWFITPRFGLQLDDRRHAKAGDPLGERRAIFGQLKADLYPGAISDRMKISLLAQRYVDLSSSNGLTERAETFAKAGVEFLLYPPRLQNAVLQPSIALERSYGADLLNGLTKQGLTQLVLKLKIN
jgi:hypothetical protein